ncbi:MAG: hypothetical protein JWO35_904 [Candidatus Saccharibacteria bacterium]|nr:hypothetical protein [Candidatus Saccharibacteria bacterium]
MSEKLNTITAANEAVLQSTQEAINVIGLSEQSHLHDDQRANLVESPQYSALQLSTGTEQNPKPDGEHYVQIDATVDSEGKLLDSTSMVENKNGLFTEREGQVLISRNQLDGSISNKVVTGEQADKMRPIIARMAARKIIEAAQSNGATTSTSNR